MEEKAPVVRGQGGAAPIIARWLGRIAYRDAWALQRALVTARQAGQIPDQLLLLEHDPVITLGRNAAETHVIAPAAVLAERGIDVIRVERGGEVTYHGPGQLVAYPIVGLAGRHLGVRSFVGALEGAMADACAAAGVAAGPRAGHPGCWCDPAGLLPRKIGALGIRVSRGVTFHGIALNVVTNMADFDLIDPCGMPGLASTSIARERGGRDEPVEPDERADRGGPVDRDEPVDRRSRTDRDARGEAAAGPGSGAAAGSGTPAAIGPAADAVARVASDYAVALARRLGAPLAGHLPPDADPGEERRALEAITAAATSAPGGSGSSRGGD